MNLPVIITTSLLLCAAHHTDASQQSLFRQVTRGLEPVDKRFLCDHNCKVYTTPRRVEGGPSAWNITYLQCDNVDELIWTVACDRFCVNPRTCRRMRKYKNVPVTYGFHFKTRDGTRTVQIPVACSCQLRNERPACPQPTRRRRRNRT